MLKKLNIKIRPTEKIGLLHDSRADVRILAATINTLINKVNELVDENNKLHKIISDNKIQTI